VRKTHAAGVVGPVGWRQRVAHANREIAGAGDERTAVGALGDAVDEVGVAAQRGELFAADHVGNENGRVPGSRIWVRHRISKRAPIIPTSDV
jgi:hypothetical protein